MDQIDGLSLCGSISFNVLLSSAQARCRKTSILVVAAETGQMTRPEDNTGVALPLSLEDAARATREILKVVDSLISRGGKVVDAYRWYKRKEAARHLDVLRFKEGGFVNLVRKIASGEFDEKEISAINSLMDETRLEVEESMHQLRRFSHILREQIGIQSAMKLEDILYSMWGKGQIRIDLHEITSRYHSGSKIEAGIHAERVLSKIETINREIISLHETILRERKAAKSLPLRRPKNPDPKKRGRAAAK